MSLASVSFIKFPLNSEVDSGELMNLSFLFRHLDAMPFANDTLRYGKIVHAMSTKVDEVKSLFESPQPYLERRRYNINIRADAVQYFLRNREFTTILDVGCGDGSASIPLLNPQRSLTLLDLSSQMLSIAQSQVPPNLSQNIRAVNRDFLGADLAPHSFDVIICLGFLAHVDSPKAVIEKIAQLLRPAGIVILQSTDSSGFPSRLGIAYRRVL